MSKLNWKFVSVSQARGSIMFMLCMGDKLILELSNLKTKKVKGHTVTEGTTSAPFEYAQIVETWIEKSGVKLQPPTIADYAKSVNHGQQLSFVKDNQKPSVPVQILDIHEWKRLQKEANKE
jgi:hypothetical protein